MSSNFIICIKAVIPMFLMLALGYGGRRQPFGEDEQPLLQNAVSIPHVSQHIRKQDR